MIRLLTNNEIYSYLDLYMEADFSNVFIPVRINFYIQKNIQELVNKYTIIEEMRKSIINQYGDTLEDGSISYSRENVEKAEKELKDLKDIKQEVNIKSINLSDIEDLSLTTKQLQSLMFMIEDGEKGER